MTEQERALGAPAAGSPKHTPGPWEAYRAGDTWHVRTLAEGGYGVASVAPSRLGFTHPIDAADAHLIAAAPALADALEALARENEERDRRTGRFQNSLTEMARLALRAAWRLP